VHSTTGHRGKKRLEAAIVATLSKGKKEKEDGFAFCDFISRGLTVPVRRGRNRRVSKKCRGGEGSILANDGTIRKGGRKNAQLMN